MNKELLKNAEGYTDPTAAATLTQREPGDIWTYKDGECLIIKSHAGFATILRLHDNDLYGDRVKVTDRYDGPRYVDPSFIITGRYKEMGRYVETLDVETFKRVVEATEDAIGLRILAPVEIKTVPREETDIQEEAKLLELSGRVCFLQEQLTDLEHRHNLQRAELTAANNVATKAKNQLELLRDMYNELLAKAVWE